MTKIKDFHIKDICHHSKEIAQFPEKDDCVYECLLFLLHDFWQSNMCKNIK